MCQKKKEKLLINLGNAAVDLGRLMAMMMIEKWSGECSCKMGKSGNKPTRVEMGSNRTSARFCRS